MFSKNFSAGSAENLSLSSLLSNENAKGPYSVLRALLLSSPNSGRVEEDAQMEDDEDDT